MTARQTTPATQHGHGQGLGRPVGGGGAHAELRRRVREANQQSRTSTALRGDHR